MAFYNQKGFTALEFAVVTTLVGVIGAVSYLTYRNNQTAIKLASPALVKAISPAPSVTDAWQAISNPNGTWATIKAPQGWVYVVCDGGGYVGLATDKSRLGVCNSGAVSQVGLSYSSHQPDNTLVAKAPDDKIFMDEAVVIDGIQGHKYTKVKQTGSDIAYSGFKYVTYVVSSKGNVYMATYTQNETDHDNSAIVDQIVRTWKL